MILLLLAAVSCAVCLDPHAVYAWDYPTELSSRIDGYVLERADGVDGWWNEYDRVPCVETPVDRVCVAAWPVLRDPWILPRSTHRWRVRAYTGATLHEASAEIVVGCVPEFWSGP